MENYVVTGGAGFIGSHVVEELVRQKQTVTVIDNLLTGKKENIAPYLSKINFLFDSITNKDVLKTAFADADYVIHLAALPSVPRSIKDPLASHENNLTGSLTVFDVAKEMGVKRVVYASSSSVYGNSETLPKVETMPKKPLSFYALQKSTVEEYTKLYHDLYGSEFVGMRFFNVFGSRQDPYSNYAAVIPKFIKLMKKGVAPTIYGDGKTSRDFTYITNVVDGLITACKHPNKIGGEVFNLAYGERYSLNELVAELNTLLETNLTPTYEDFRAGDVKHSQAGTQKMKRILKFESKVNFKDGLKEVVKYY